MLPKHIAIIMDGNGRWAKTKGLPRIEGHRKGVEAVEEIVTAVSELGVSHLTLYAFSDENWHRPKEEVEALMQILEIFLKEKQEKMIQNGIRFGVIGDTARLSDRVKKVIADTIEITKYGEKTTLTLALSYGARNEIVRAANKLVKMGKEVTEENFSACLDTINAPDPDLLIRTSGEFRLSNFLLWQLAYAELYFTKTMWPDFNRAELKRALDAFEKRERRFGKISEQLK